MNSENSELRKKGISLCDLYPQKSQNLLKSLAKLGIIRYHEPIVKHKDKRVK